MWPKAIFQLLINISNKNIKHQKFLTLILFPIMVKISVVVFDYSRDTYIRDNISKIKKECNNIDCEIIVLKSYLNKSLEEFFTGNSIIYYNLMENKRQSDYIKASIKYSTGDVIAYMDDDDLIIPGRLKKIEKLFTEDNFLGYYHNNFITIDNNGNIIKNRNYITPVFETAYIDNKNKKEWFNKNKFLKKLLYIRPDFNSSSIAIRKKLLENFQNDYEFNVRPDTFIMLIALMSDYSLLIDSEPLTYYRISDENVSTSYNADIDKMRSIYTKAFSEGISALDYYGKITGNKYTKYMELRKYNLQLAYNFWSCSKKYKFNLNKIIFLLKIDLVHELFYYIAAFMPSRLKIMAMRLFYSAN
jgi:glycosyltransferase involved in cell wall biosynthesis